MEILKPLDLFVGEARIVGVEVERNGTKIVPASASYRIVGNDGNEILPETPATISGTKAYCLVSDADVTASPGGYKLIWKITYEQEVYITVQPIRVKAV